MVAWAGDAGVALHGPPALGWHTLKHWTKIRRPRPARRNVAKLLIASYRS